MNIDKYKNFKFFKLIQLILLILFGIMFFCYLEFDPLLRNNIYSNKNLLTICVFLWAFMLYSAVCIVADFSQLEKEITESHTLKQNAYLDSITGIPNRNGCDLIFNRYISYDDISSFGCALISLPMLKSINDENGRLFGNRYLHEFCGLLEQVTDSYGFAGRNSGNEFLIVMENCSEVTMSEYLSRLNKLVDDYNTNHDPAIKFTVDYVLNENEKQNNFISLVSVLYNNAKRG